MADGGQGRVNHETHENHESDGREMVSGRIATLIGNAEFVGFVVNSVELTRSLALRAERDSAHGSLEHGGAGWFCGTADWRRPQTLPDRMVGVIALTCPIRETRPKWFVLPFVSRTASVGVTRPL
jgi:hypothetical protein